MDAIDPLVAMAHECHSVNQTRGGGPPSPRLSDGLRVLRARLAPREIESTRVIDRVKLGDERERELIQQMISDCDAADRRYEEDLRFSDRERQSVARRPPAARGGAGRGPGAGAVAVARLLPGRLRRGDPAGHEPDAEDLTEEARAWKDWEERSAARRRRSGLPEDPFPDRRTTRTAAALAAAVRDAPPPPPMFVARRPFRTKGAREWLARTGFGTYEADPPPGGAPHRPNRASRGQPAGPGDVCDPGQRTN